jgi:hypothetical protein
MGVVSFVNLSTSFQFIHGQFIQGQMKMIGQQIPRIHRCGAIRTLLPPYTHDSGPSWLAKPSKLSFSTLHRFCPGAHNVPLFLYYPIRFKTVRPFNLPLSINSIFSGISSNVISLPVSSNCFGFHLSANISQTLILYFIG